MHASASGARVRRALALALTLMLAVAMTPLPAALATGGGGANEYYVDVATGSDTTGDGSVDNPWMSITHGMTQVGQDDVLWVKPGTYDSTVESFPIDVTPGVMLRATDGAGATTIEGVETTSVVQLQMYTENTWVKSFTITGGKTDLGGGGISISSIGMTETVDGWPKIMHNTIIANEATAGAGVGMTGVPASWCNPYIADNTIKDNAAFYAGGGIGVGWYCAPEIYGNTIWGNSSTWFGGGISTSPTVEPSIQHNYIKENTAGYRGGGLHVGGGNDATATISYNKFYSNDAGNDGGGARLHEGDFTLDGNRFYDNVAVDDGGALIIADSTVEMSDSFFKKNACGTDNVNNSGGIAWITNCIGWMSHTTAFSNTGGWAGLEVAAGDFRVRNSIFWDHGGEDIRGADLLEYTCTQDTNLAGDGNTVGAGVIHGDPMFFNMGGGDYRLELDSPCVDSAAAKKSDDKDIDKQTRPMDGDGDGVATQDMGCWERPDVETERYAGDNRYETAVDLVKGTFTWAGTVIIASGENYPDALAAAGMAGSYNAPLLLTPKDSIPSIVLDALDDLGTNNLIIIGGTAAVSDKVETLFEQTGFTVDRIFGADRYETSAKVARAIADHQGGGFGKRAFFARGDSFPDALAVAPLAYSVDAPILLTATTYLPGSVASAITDLDIESGVICGGTSAVSAGVQGTIDGLLLANGGTATERWFGADRYETAKAIAEGGVDGGYIDWEYVGIATGTNFPDALAGGITTGRRGGVVLLTMPNSLSGPTQAALGANNQQVLETEVFGGTAAVDAAVQAAIEAALGW